MKRLRHNWLLKRGWKVHNIKRWERLIHLGRDKAIWTTVTYTKENKFPKQLRFNGHYEVETIMNSLPEKESPSRPTNVDINRDPGRLGG